jgi:hypothetical protein
MNINIESASTDACVHLKSTLRCYAESTKNAIHDYAPALLLSHGTNIQSAIGR